MSPVKNEKKDSIEHFARLSQIGDSFEKLACKNTIEGQRSFNMWVEGVHLIV